MTTQKKAQEVIKTIIFSLEKDRKEKEILLTSVTEEEKKNIKQKYKEAKNREKIFKFILNKIK